MTLLLTPLWACLDLAAATLAVVYGQATVAMVVRPVGGTMRLVMELVVASQGSD